MECGELLEKGTMFVSLKKIWFLTVWHEWRRCLFFGIVYNALENSSISHNPSYLFTTSKLCFPFLWHCEVLDYTKFTLSFTTCVSIIDASSHLQLWHSPFKDISLYNKAIWTHQNSCKTWVCCICSDKLFIWTACSSSPFVIPICACRISRMSLQCFTLKRQKIKYFPSPRSLHWHKGSRIFFPFSNAQKL